MKKVQFAKIFILGLILIGIFSLVEFNPKPVLSQSKYGSACTQYPAGIATPRVKDSSIVDQEEYKREGATWEYRWEADCTQGCSNNSDCTANTANAPAVGTGTSAWCFEFTDGNRCMILTTTDKGAGEDNNKSGGKFGQGGAKAGQSGPGSAASDAACKDAEATKKSYYDAKVANNLVRFYAIMNGAGGLCVPADLGIGNQEDADATDDSGKGRLVLCSTNEGGLVWRVVVSNALKPVKGKTDPNITQTMQYYKDSGKLKAAREIAGLPGEESQ